ncbi:MAG TPA: 5'-3' exonuclease H3TH domain-containing protein [Egibacteraceae bacterium]|nr:5'-3' exonuclease H3TH domain-containing protein [Egibacteraceae bacterium]
MRLLLDTSSVLYRAFFALPTSITAPDGSPVNAVRGYLDMTARLVADRRPHDVVHVLDDDWRPAPRVAAFPGYKSERAPDPEGLPAQFSLLSAVLDAVGHTQVHAPGWEADDAIGALCAAARGEERIDVVTGDRDLLQLVRDPHVRVLFTVKGVSELTVFDEAAVLERYGVPAGRYVDFAILRGDPSDGLPGVPGVGPKTAADLVTAYPDLDALLADAASQTPRLAQRLAAAGEYLTAMRSVVPVVTDVALETRTGTRDDATLDDLAEHHNLEGPVNRLREALDG